MRWRGRRTSGRIRDRRGVRAAGAVGGVGGVAGVLLLLAGWYFGIDVTPFLEGGGGPVRTEVATGPNEIDDEDEEFVAVVLADTEEVWADLFPKAFGEPYRPPELVLFTGAVRSACGSASSAMGPFYCPGDRRAYLDMSFFRTLSQRLGAEGDFARAYVIAHEVAHHVQNELGILGEVNARRARVSERESNALSVRVELQADCLSGVWARRADERFAILEEGDIREAMNAAAQIGDDTLQRRSGQVVRPDSFQHGSSDQRVRWFQTGFESGDPRDCDTFSARSL